MRSYDPDERAAEKAASRQRDEDALQAGHVTPAQLQYVNGGRGMFRRSVLKRKKDQQAANKKTR